MKQPKVALALTLLVSVWVHAQSNHRRDGNWWNGETQGEKFDHMVGFFDGMELGHKFSYWKMAKPKSDENPDPCLSKTIESYGEYSTNFFKNVTNQQLADGLDSFYKDYRNRSILIHDAVWVVVRTIAGTPQQEIDKLIENLRKNASTE